MYDTMLTILTNSNNVNAVQKILNVILYYSEFNNFKLYRNTC